MTIRTLIVDDEDIARDGLRNMLERESDIKLIGECTDGREALDVIEREQPDLVFLDIQMTELDGFAMLDQLDGPLPFIIFVTAHSEYAVQAFDVNAVDYLLKPFTNKRFYGALDKARRHLRSGTVEELSSRVAKLVERLDAERHTDNHDYLQRIALKKRDRMMMLDVEEIDWIEAADNYVSIHAGDRTHLLRATLTELEEQLDPDHFVRVHRSRIVNIDRVREVQPLGSGDCLLILHDGTELNSSRTYSERRRQALNLSS